MAEYKLNKKEESNGFYTSLPTVYPTDLQESLQIFENIRYKSYGFGMVFLDYNYTLKYWSVAFRNAANFTNPDIKAKTPIEAVHQMFDFLKTLKIKG
jgi:hypothetical protein